LSELDIPDVPKLQSAAFIAPIRKRTTDWKIEDKAMDVEKDEQNDQKSSQISSEKESAAKESAASVAEHGLSRIDKRAKREKIIDPIGEYEMADLNEENIEKDSKKPPGVGKVKDTSLVEYDVMLGVAGESPQYGILGEVSGRKVALDLNHTHTISLFGVQGGGKSYTLGTVIEMASMPINNINVLPHPLATVIFHYSPTQDYSPEFTSMIHENTVEEEIKILRERFGGKPQGLSDVLILTPADKVEERKMEYPDIEVRPIAFSSSELKAIHWKFLIICENTIMNNCCFAMMTHPD